MTSALRREEAQARLASPGLGCRLEPLAPDALLLLLCVRKKMGGLGFQNLQFFNISMLGKLGWRFISDPNALVCRVLKAKYFVKGEFLNVHYGHSPSFTWRSICASQDLVRKGLRWRIGTGANVSVWKDPWLRRDECLFPFHPLVPELSDLCVSDLFMPGTRTWDVEIITDLFAVNDVKEILSIPLNPTSTEDKLIWHYSKNGMYSVRSAYILACSITIDHEYTLPGNWIKLWNAKVPFKVKIFPLRALHKCLPTKSNLASKGISIGGECGICHMSFENEWYSFIVYPFAEGCWKAAGLEHWIRIAEDSCASFAELIFFLLDCKEETIKVKGILLMWFNGMESNSSKSG